MNTGRDRYHPLRVARLVHETCDAVSVALDVPEDRASTMTYEAGQFVTLRVTIGDDVHVRSYSMSSAPSTDPALQITVKRVPGGAVSNWLNDHVVAGDTLEVSAPAGDFVLTDAAEGDDDIVAIAGGSGITPIYSILKEAMATTSRRARLLFANPRREAAIFGRQLDELAARHPDRLTVQHHADADRGFLTARELSAFLGSGPADVYICGPEGLMELAEVTAGDAELDPERVHLERFAPLAPTVPAGPSGRTLTVTVGGRTETIAHRNGLTVLQSARWVGLRAPSTCELGNCASCMAMVVEGEVEMRVNDALTPEEVAEGWVLTCQAVPVTDVVRVVYEP